MRDFGVRPKRDLGQNFLIDSNILGVIAREARLEPDDVVLEIGGGLGVLSEYLAPRVAHVHVVELDRALEPALHDAVDPFRQRHAALRRRDEARPARARPRRRRRSSPTCPTASRRARSCARSRSSTTCGAGSAWSRRRSASGSPPGPARARTALPSVLAQLACDVQVLRPVSRSVFSPVPNVDSVLVGLERTGPAPEPDLRELVAAAFAHRRKALAGSLALAPGAAADIRARARDGARRARPPARCARRAPVAAGLSRAAR